MLGTLTPPGKRMLKIGLVARTSVGMPHYGKSDTKKAIQPDKWLCIGQPDTEFESVRGAACVAPAFSFLFRRCAVKNDSKWVDRKFLVSFLGCLFVLGLIVGVGLSLGHSSAAMAAGNTIEVKGGSTVTFQGMPADDRIVIDGKSHVTFSEATQPPEALTGYRRDGNFRPVSFASAPKPKARDNVAHNYYGNVIQYHVLSPSDLPEGRAGQRQMAQWNREFGQP